MPLTQTSLGIVGIHNHFIFLKSKTLLHYVVCVQETWRKGCSVCAQEASRKKKSKMEKLMLLVGFK